MSTTDLPTPLLADAGVDPEASADSEAPRASLSPSRASDFMSCPLLYRFRVIDHLPEAPSPAATRGTVVHAVLERLFDLPAVERTLQRAAAMVQPEWERLLAEEPELAALLEPGLAVQAPVRDETVDGPPAGDGVVLDDHGLPTFLEGAEGLLGRYFELEDPQRLEPAERELRVEVELDSGLVLRGFVDRLDVAPSGDVRVVDYKTGRAPGAGFEAKAMFQMRFYALVLWRAYGRVPRLLQLLYLGSGEVLRYQPDEADLRATEVKVKALWEAIARATETGDWRPSPSKLCDWCDYRETYCPAWGGTPPPLPVPGAVSGAISGAAPGKP